MNWIRFTNRLFGARIQINEPDRVQFETNEPFVSESVSVKQAYPLIALPLCIDKLQSYTDLCVHKLEFSGDLTGLILIKLLR